MDLDALRDLELAAFAREIFRDLPPEWDDDRRAAYGLVSQMLLDQVSGGDATELSATARAAVAEMSDEEVAAVLSAVPDA